MDLDRTTFALFPARQRVHADVVAQARGILSGVAVAQALAQLVGVRCRAHAHDGDRVRPGMCVLSLEGGVRRVLGVERTMLNYLMHLSGVATATAKAVRSVQGRAPLAIYGTRKTLPGLRDLEKNAIQHGGGHPHRRDLASSVLIKNTHLALLPLADAVRRARSSVGRSLPLEVEVRSPREALRAVNAGADAILLDNCSPRQARAILRGLEDAGVRERVWVELSGGLNAAGLRKYRGVGADAASLGSLTHSAPALPFHLMMRRGKGPRRVG